MFLETLVIYCSFKLLSSLLLRGSHQRHNLSVSGTSHKTWWAAPQLNARNSLKSERKRTHECFPEPICFGWPLLHEMFTDVPSAQWNCPGVWPISEADSQKPFDATKCSYVVKFFCMQFFQLRNVRRFSWFEMFLISSSVPFFNIGIGIPLSPHQERAPAKFAFWSVGKLY